MTPPARHTDALLEQLLRRGDIWRGQSQSAAPQTALDTGHAPLNEALLHKGWPLATLVEIHQELAGQGEWLLLTPALRRLTAGYTVLLNPPALPFAAGLIQLGLDLDRLLVVQASSKPDFLAGFLELARSPICAALLAWQPKHNLSYTELRKCLLAANESRGLRLLFRPARVQQQSSPAVLRLATKLHSRALELHIFKQKGWLGAAASRPLQLPLPETWMPLAPYGQLDQSSAAESQPDLRWSKP
jgi:protein ImuA